MDNKTCFLALNRIPRLGPRTCARLWTRWPELAELFQLPPTVLQKAGLSPVLAQAIAAFDERQLDLDRQWQAAMPHRALLTWADAAYPALLKEIPDPPMVLYAVGDISLFQTFTLAMVGTRTPSILGSETAGRFAFELAEAGITIVSGLALGIDASAHRGCLAAKGKTIAVMGTGVDCIYPTQHRALAAELRENGLLVSEFPLQTPPLAGHFPRRNRIISGLSWATLVVEAAIKSGSLITARLALEQNRDVMAIPGSIYNKEAQGCHWLLQQGAKLVTSTQDILDELRISPTTVDKSGTSFTLEQENDNLVKCIDFEVTTVDKILRRSGLSFEQVVCRLAELELQGRIKASPGGYLRCV